MNIPRELFKQYLLQIAPHVPGSTRIEHAAHKTNAVLHKMSSNENMLGPSPRAIEAIQTSLHLLHEYSYQNDERLRRALAAHFDHELSPAQFITANGGMELLDLICRGFLEPGDECILSSPTFLAYKSFASVQ